MISLITRNQNNAKTQNLIIFLNNEICEIIILSKVFKQQIVQQVNKFDQKNTSIINHVFVLKITLTFSQNEKNFNEEYQRFFAIKRKTQQKKKILFMKKQKNKNWLTFIFTFFMHFKNVDNNQVENVSLTKSKQDMKRERYFKIIKSKIYKNHNFQKHDIFIKVCQIVYNVWSIIYNDYSIKLILLNHR